MPRFFFWDVAIQSPHTERILIDVWRDFYMWIFTVVTC